MAVQDRVFLQGAHVDPVYQARREQAFILAVNCGRQDCGTCFCVSMGAGPRATAGFDLALTEVFQEGTLLPGGGRHQAGGRAHPGTARAHRDARGD